VARPLRTLIFHGTFDTTADWGFLNTTDIDAEVFNLWEFLRENPIRSWAELTESLKSKISPYDRLIGYSLGGRILLNLVAAGIKTKELMFISTNTGLGNEEQRTERICNDLRWKEKVLTIEWADLFVEWNSQGIFLNAKKDEESFMKLEPWRNEIALTLDVLSLGRMMDFNQKPNMFLGHKVTWLNGSTDTGCCSQGSEFASNQKISQVIVKGVGHRVHKEAPHEILRLLGR
jgi:hypothetical protein